MAVGSKLLAVFISASQNAPGAIYRGKLASAKVGGQEFRSADKRCSLARQSGVLPQRSLHSQRHLQTIAARLAFVARHRKIIANDRLGNQAIRARCEAVAKA